MHTRTINNFEDYVAFIADHVSPAWTHYSKADAKPNLRLEEIFGEPKAYPVTVGIEWEQGEERGIWTQEDVDAVYRTADHWLEFFSGDSRSKPITP